MMKARLPQGFGGKGVGNNMQQFAVQAQKLQEEIDTANEELDEKEYEATSGGGAVKVTVKGNMEVQSITISPEVVDPDDTEMLSDLVIAAVNEALRAANSERDSVMDDISSGFNLQGLF